MRRNVVGEQRLQGQGAVVQRVKAFLASRWGGFIAISLASLAIFAAAVAILHLLVALFS